MSVERDGSEMVHVRDGDGNEFDMQREYFEAHRLPSWRIVKRIRLEELGVPARDLPNGIWLHVLEVLQFYGLAPSPASVVLALAKLIDETLIENGGRLRADGTVDRELDSQAVPVNGSAPAEPLLEDFSSSCMQPAERPWVVRAAWCNSSPTYYGPFASSDEAGAWAKRRLDGDIACIGYEVEQLLGEGDAPSEIVESLTRAGLVD